MPRWTSGVPLSDGPATIGRGEDGQHSYPRAERRPPKTVLGELSGVAGVALAEAGRCRGWDEG
jgi:hypothetical protein